MPRAALGLHLIRHRAAVLGRPVGHSLSPVLHQAAYRALELTDWRFDRIDCGAEDVAAVLAAAGDEQAGYAVTMPCKRAALAAATLASGTAVTVGAANTLLPSGAGWLADNTDVYGLATVLRLFGAQAQLGSRDGVVVLGAGGTAQAAIVALADVGFRSVELVVRDPARAGAARDTAARAGVAVEVVAMDAADAVLRSCALLISTVPAPGAQAVSATAWRADLLALDVIYPGWPTPLAISVTAAGGRAVSGAHLLLHQAAAQVQLMTGHPAPLEPMRAALRAEVGPALDGP